MLADSSSAEIAVHASAVAIDGRALLICGPSRSGKSRLAVALVGASTRRRPIVLLGDDRILLRRTAKAFTHLETGRDLPSPLAGEGARRADEGSLARWRSAEHEIPSPSDPSSGASRHLLPQGEKGFHGSTRVNAVGGVGADLVARPHPRIAGFIERRGLGIVAMRFAAAAPVAAVVELGATETRVHPLENFPRLRIVNSPRTDAACDDAACELVLDWWDRDLRVTPAPESGLRAGAPAKN